MKIDFIVVCEHNQKWSTFISDSIKHFISHYCLGVHRYVLSGAGLHKEKQKVMKFFD